MNQLLERTGNEELTQLVLDPFVDSTDAYGSAAGADYMLDVCCFTLHFSSNSADAISLPQNQKLNGCLDASLLVGLNYHLPTPIPPPIFSY